MGFVRRKLTYSLGGGSGGSYPQPFDVSSSPNGESSISLTVRPGTVNGVLPNNWNSESFSVSNTGNFYGYVVCATDGNSITSVSLSFGNESAYNPSQTPVSGGLPTSFQYAFCFISDGQVYRIMGGGSIIAWGTTSYSKDKETALSPGEYPLDFFNVWVVKAEGDARILRN